MRVLPILMLVVAPVSYLWSCSCSGPGAPCQAAGLAAAAFTGTVLNITDQPAQFLPAENSGPIAASRRTNGTPVLLSPSARVVRLQVRDVLSGVPVGQTQIEIVTGLGDADCGYRFQVGTDYVVYAYQDGQGRLATGICTRTRPLTEAAEDLAYFRKVAGAAPLGELRVLTGSPGAGKSGVTISAEGARGRFVTQTDAAGVATFPQVEPGEYAIHQESDGDLPDDPKVQVRAKGCVDVVLLRTLRLVGRVTTKEGLPAARIEVEAQSSSGKLEASAMTDAQGKYELRVSRPGVYHLGVNLSHTPTRDTPYPRWFFPGTENQSSAAVIDFSGKPDIRNYDFALPDRQREREIEGIVLRSDGTPAPLARLFVLDGAQNTVTFETPDPTGHFRLRVFAGIPYELHAIWPGDAAGNSSSAVPMRIPADSRPLSLRLVLDQPGNSVVEASQKRSTAR